MKTFTKRISALVMALLLTVAMVPAAAQAAVSAPKSVTAYLQSNYGGGFASIDVSGLTGKQSITKSSVKSSAKSVVNPSYVYYSSSSWKRDYYDRNKPETGKNVYAHIGLDLKKAGSSTVTFKAGGKTFKTKVNVKAYTNPVKLFQAFGSSNLAGKYKKNAWVSGKLSATKKNTTVKVKAASGWKINSIDFYNAKTGDSYRFANYNKPVSSATLYTGTVKKGGSYSVNINLINTKTKGTLTIGYDLV